MRIPHRLRALLALVLVLVFAVAACGDDDDDSDDASGSGSPAATAAPAGDDGGGITIAGFQFEAPASVEGGATVAITNNDSAPHTVTADDGAFDSGQIDADGSGSFTAPAEPGTYAFHCEIHTSMKGELVVA